MILIADSLSGANIILAAIVVYYQILFLRRQRGRSFDWIKLLYAIVGAYWSAIYVFILFLIPTNYDSVWFGQVFIRPAFTFTLAVMVASAIQRAKTP